MSMESVASRTLYRQTHARGGDLRALANRALLKRIWQFSARHHRRLGGFVAVSVVGALLAVSTPVLAAAWSTPSCTAGRLRRWCSSRP